MEVWYGGTYNNSDMELNAYDQEGNLTEITNQSWSNGAWVVDGKELREYYQDGNLETKIFLNRENAVLINYKKEIHQYDNDNRVVSLRTQYWFDSIWNDHERLVFEYVGNNLTERLTEGYNSGNWEPEYLVSYSYDSNDVVTEELHQTTDGLSYEDRYRYSFVNNSDGLRISEMRQRDLQGNGWENIDRYEYDYDAHSTRIRYSSSQWYDVAWEPWQHSYYYFDCNTTGIEDLTASSMFSVFPNPAADQINIKLTNPAISLHSIRLVDGTGRLIQATTSNYFLNLNCASGIYFVLIDTNIGSFSRKVMVN